MVSPWLWISVIVLCLGLCTYLPIRIKNDALRQRVSWFVLVPVSLVLILYGYPVGIELFRKLAIAWS